MSNAVVALAEDESRAPQNYLKQRHWARHRGYTMISFACKSYFMISLELSLSSGMCTPPLRGPRRDRDDDDDPRFRKFGGRDDRDDGPRAHPTAE